MTKGNDNKYGSIDTINIQIVTRDYIFNITKIDALVLSIASINVEMQPPLSIAVHVSCMHLLAFMPEGPGSTHCSCHKELSWQI